MPSDGFRAKQDQMSKQRNALSDHREFAARTSLKYTFSKSTHIQTVSSVPDVEGCLSLLPVSCRIGAQKRKGRALLPISHDIDPQTVELDEKTGSPAYGEW
jgi:hypothetical protein